MGNTLQNTDQLTAAFKNNDEKVMQKVYQHTFPKFRAHVLKNSGDEAQAKDVFQEAFIACWRNIKEDKVAKNNNVEAYLFSIAKNKWTDFLRSSKFKKTVSADTVLLKIVTEEPEFDQTIEEEQNKNAMQNAMAELGNNCKKLLKMFYYERRSMEEISLEMGMAPNSARNQKYRCMQQLRNLSLQLKNNGK